MKIPITTDLYQPAINGVVTPVVNLSRSLEQLGNEVRILTLSGTHRSYRRDNVTYIGSANAGFIYPNVRVQSLQTNYKNQRRKTI